MNEFMFNPEINRPNWLPSLSLTTVLHLLLLLTVLYAPGFRHPRHEVKEVVHLVDILNPLEPDKVKIRPPSRPGPTKEHTRQMAPITNPLGQEARNKNQPAMTDLSPAAKGQAQPVNEYNPYGQASNQQAARQLEEKTGGTADASNQKTTTGKTGPAVVTPGGAGTEEREAARKRYLAGLMVHIESCKFYPPAARIRRLEGTIQVRFTLEAGGLISGLQVSNGEPILEQAAREAVERALPLPAPKGAASTPLPVSYQMNFQLR